MRKIQFAIMALLSLLVFSACSDSETYADQKKKERSAIAQYIATNKINTISETIFAQQGYTTDVSKNQYVLLDQSGVYMQICNEGCGEKIQNGESLTVICRYTEVNIMEGDTISTNMIPYYSSMPDLMNVTNTSGSFTATFDTGSSVMYRTYSSTSVPTGWLVPLSYIKIGYPKKEGEEIAHVKLIVPHSAGQSYATQYVYPCYYDITYQAER